MGQYIYTPLILPTSSKPRFNRAVMKTGDDDEKYPKYIIYPWQRVSKIS